MATTLPKFRGFRSTGIQQPTASTSGGYSSVPSTQPTTPEPPKKKPGFFSSLAKGIVQPAIDYTKFVGEAAAQGGRALLDKDMRKAVFQPNKMTEEDHIRLADKRKTFFVDEEDIKDRKTIGKTGLKRTAGAMTYAIPGGIGGKGLAGAAKAGAVAGGLYGVYEGEDIDPANIGKGVFTGAVTAPAMMLGGRGLSKAARGVSNRTKGVQAKLGQKLLDEADDYAVKSTRINTSRQNKFQQATGKTIGEFVEQNNLYGQDLDAVQGLIDPLQKARSQAIRGGNKMVNPMDIIDDFNRQIKNLSTGSNALDPSNLRRARALQQARDQFADEAIRYANEIGDQTVSQYPLSFLDDARASIDRNTPSSQFLTNPEQAGNQRAIGSVYRDRVNTTAGTKEAGLKLRDLYQFRDALERAPKGNNTLPFGLNQGVWGTMGGVATKLPFGVGESIGMVGQSIVNNPKNIGRMSRGMKAAGNAMMNGRMPQMPRVPGANVAQNAVRNVPNSVPRNAALNAASAGVINATTPGQGQMTYQQFLQQSGMPDGEQARQAYMATINGLPQQQNQQPQSSQLPRFRGFTGGVQ